MEEGMDGNNQKHQNGTIHVAVVGCSHGEIDKIYEIIQNIEQERKIKVSLVLCSGDFQSVRNMTDLRCMNCPVKYQAMHDFHRYYSGEKQAPILTLFIGGNHEASNFLQELPFGGWVAPNIFYVGYTNVLKFGPLRIAGISGIFKGQDYLKGRFECPPYDQNSIRSTYHYRNLDIFRLKQISSHVDIVLSHDWPRGVYNFGNTQELLRRKPFFRSEVERNELGSRPLSEVLSKLQPSYWFSAHMHVLFDAIVPHDSAPANVTVSERDVQEEGGIQNPCNSNTKETKFLALDKVLPRRHFLQVIDIPIQDLQELKLSYDPEWLAILKSTDHLMTARPKPCFMPGPGCNSRFDFSPTDKEIKSVLLQLNNELFVPENFTPTGPKFIPREMPGRAFPIVNPQTVEFCNKLGLTDPISLVAQPYNEQKNPNFIAADVNPLSKSFQEYVSPFSSLSRGNSSHSQNASASTKTNPDEIPLDLDDDENDINSSTKLEDSHSRNKMKLPSPKSSSSIPGESRTIDLDSETKQGEQNPNDQLKKMELQLLADVFASKNEFPTTANQSVENSLFVIDKVGTTNSSEEMVNEPELKRKRNQALFDALENELQE